MNTMNVWTQQISQKPEPPKTSSTFTLDLPVLDGQHNLSVVKEHKMIQTQHVNGRNMIYGMVMHHITGIFRLWYIWHIRPFESGLMTSQQYG